MQATGGGHVGRGVDVGPNSPNTFGNLIPVSIQFDRDRTVTDSPSCTDCQCNSHPVMSVSNLKDGRVIHPIQIRERY